jgi:hypothetical protein
LFFAMSIVIDVTCQYCELAFEVECENPSGLDQMDSQRIACPRCGADNARALPGDIIEIWKPGERLANPDEASFLWPTRCPNAHDVLLPFRPSTLRESLANGTLTFYCIRCNTTWAPSPGEEGTLNSKLAGGRPS